MNTSTVWHTFQQGLKTYLTQKVKDESLAKDLLQDTFLKIQENIHQLDDQARLAGWIYRVANSVVADHFRKEKRLSLQQEKEAISGDPQSAEEYTKMEEMALWLPYAIENLPEKYREAVRLAEIEGLSQKKLAEQLGISYSGAKSRVQRGREKLKEEILECCRVETDAYGNILEYYPKETNQDDCCEK